MDRSRILRLWVSLLGLLCSLWLAPVLAQSGSVVVDDPEVLFQGGPVHTDAVLAVALAAVGGEGGAGFAPMGDRYGTLDLDTPLELVTGTIDRLRMFIGYAGWGAQQLRDEIDRGDWYVVPATDEDVFGCDHVAMGRRILRRQPGDLALHATRPADPYVN